MLKDRQEGLYCLHGIALLLTARWVFLAWAAVLNFTEWIRLAESVNLPLYFVGVLAAALWVMHSLRGYQQRLGNPSWGDAARIARHQIVRFVAILFTIVFVTKDTSVSRLFLTGYIALMAGTLFLANRFYPRLIIRLFFHDAVMRTALIAPPGEIEELADWIRGRQHLGIELVGWVSDAGGHPAAELPLLGSLAELRRIVIEHEVSQFVVAQAAFDPKQANEIARCVQEAGCRVKFYTNARRAFGSLPISIEHDGDYTFVMLTAEPLENPANRALKRALDIAIALPVVVFVLPPLVALVAAMQRLQSPGPVFHRQYRSGLNRRKFLIYKFRTMHVAGEHLLGRQAQRQDARVYPFGRFLRRSSLDEIPQFLNVLLGDMSVSGPRPHLIEHDEQFAKIVNTYYTRHFVKPGITGLAQSKGYRGEISEVSMLHQRIGYDMLYIRRWSLLLDIRILFETVRQVFIPPRSAY